MFGERIPEPFAVPQMEKPDLGPQIQMPAPKKRAGMFGGGAGQFLTNFILNLAAGRGNPGAMASLQMLNQRRQQAAEQEQYGQRREDEFQDWVRKQAYQQAHPNPVNNDTVADYNFWKGVLPPDKFQQYIENKVVNPPQLMNVPGVGIVSVPRMGGQQAPTAPVGRLTPLDEGGPGLGGPGGFPPSGY